MALGNALTITAIGLTVQRARTLAQRLTRDNSASPTASLVLAGSLFLIVIGGLLWQSAAAVPGGIRPFG
ncbi:nickel transporter|nr:nickel transporter [Candidatus Pantoea persica]